MSLKDLIGKTVREVNVGLAELFDGDCDESDLRRGQIYQVICTDGSVHHYFTYSDLDLAFDTMMSLVEVRGDRLFMDGRDFNGAVMVMDFVSIDSYPEKVYDYLLKKVKDNLLK